MIKNLKNKRGITLVALIITVIIMLILAGVAVSVLTGDGGLFSKTLSAAEEYNKQSAIEKLKIKIYDLNMDLMLDTKEAAKLSDLPKWRDSSTAYYDSEITDVQVASTEATVKMDGYTFTVDSNLTITHIDGALANTGTSSSGGSTGNTGGSSTGGSTSGGTSGGATGTPEQPTVTPGSVSGLTVKLESGMVPVVYSESDTSWYVATQDQISSGTWYSYVDTSTEETANKSQWANIMLRDNLKVDNNGTELAVTSETSLSDLYGKKVTSEGSMFVWIPRYAYKIESGYHTDQSGEISIKFLNTNNTYKDGSSTSTSLTNPLVGSVDTTSYRVHPAFTWAKEDGTKVELEGIWIGKFEASSANGTYTATQAGNVETTIDTTTPANSIILRTVGNVSSWRSINRNNLFLNCYNMNSSDNATIYGLSTNKDVVDPHLIKNTEWGAAVYLAQSKYGRNKITDETMSNLTGYNTGNGNYKTNVGLSTTGNVYGIYDMAGGAWEHTAAYVDSTVGGTVANTYLTSASYGKALYDAADKYKDVYVIGKSDDRVRNYAANAAKYGDAVFETSYTSYDGSSYLNCSWNSDRSDFPFSSYPFFYRGGYYSTGAAAGVFAFTNYTGEAHANDGFRAALATL